MSRVFFDSNVVLYVLDVNEPAKQVIAEALLLKYRRSGDGVISTQILQETYHNATKKFKLPPDAIADFVRELASFEVIGSSGAFVLGAIELARRVQLSIWDALIVSAAARAGCATLYTEDLNHGQVVSGVKIVNPFKSSEPV